jgi:hypothetical protein
MIMIAQNDENLTSDLRWHISLSRSGTTDKTVPSLLDQDTHSYLHTYWAGVVLTLTTYCKGIMRVVKGYKFHYIIHNMKHDPIFLIASGGENKEQKNCQQFAYDAD